jgi:CHAT domain-containing protein
MIHPLPRSTQAMYRSLIVYSAFIISISLLLIPIEIRASRSTSSVSNGVKPYAGVAGLVQDNQPNLQTGPPIERKLAGGDSHYYAYQLSLTIGQYAKLIVHQKGIDVLVKLFGPDGKPIAEFDSVNTTDGQETVSWVAEVAGSYRVDVVAKQKDVEAGRYEIKVAEVRVANENDRALYESDKLFTESGRLLFSAKYDEALPLAERAFEIRQRVLGAEHYDVARSLNRIANIYFFDGYFTKAEPYYRRALETSEKLLGPENSFVLGCRDNLALSYKQMGDYSKAEPLYQATLDIRQKSLGLEHPLVGLSLENIANLYTQKGDYVKAEPIYQRALAIGEKGLGPDHPGVARILNSIALLYYYSGDYAKAEPLYLRALAIGEKSLGAESSEGTGYVYQSIGIEICEYLFNLAVLYRDQRNYDKAEPLFQRALTISEKSLGPENSITAKVLHHWSILHRRRGDYAKAESFTGRALKMAEKTLVPDDPEIAISLSDTALLYAAKGDISQAIASLSRANAIVERDFTRNLVSGSERQKLAYLTFFSKQTNLSQAISLHSQAAPSDPQALDLAFTTLLRHKGRGLDAMTDTIATLRRNATQQDRALFDELKATSSELASLKLKDSSAGDIATFRKRIKDLEDKVDKLENELSSRSREFQVQTQPVTIASVQAALPADSALIEFALHTPLDPKTEEKKQARYLAYILTAKGQPKWVDLGESAKIDRAVDVWREALRDPNRTDVKLLARDVDEKVMRPVRSLLGETRRLLIAPDSLLSLIPFAALIDEQNLYLLERYSISYLTSGRDLLRLQTPQPSKDAPLVVANPDFGRFATIAMRTDRGAGNARAQIDPTQIFFQPLPGTEDEALAIKTLLPKASVLRREQATERALKQTSGPRILHIATHGFFLNNQDAAPVDNPLRIGSAETAAATDPAQASPYTVQLESLQALETAQEKVKGFRSRGLNAYIVRTDVNGKGTFFRVRAGNFRTQGEASKYGADLQEKGVVSDYFVARYESPQRGIQLPAGNDPLPNLRLSKFATQVEDPLLRSGLALAGANHGKSGEEDDGILTALEAAYLDLSGTKLVVLSACDTGVGEVKKGEGVQGLRRAFVLAGSESQVMSLWPVSDEAAKDLMIPYYKALQQGEGRGEALRQVQLRMLHGRKDQRHPFFWAAFIQSGEWANLDKGSELGKR